MKKIFLVSCLVFFLIGFSYSESVLLNGMEIDLINIESVKLSNIYKEGILVKKVILKIEENEIPLKEASRIKFNFIKKYIVEGILDNNISLKLKGNLIDFKKETKIIFSQSILKEIYITSGYLLTDQKVIIGVNIVYCKANGLENYDIVFDQKADGTISQVVLAKDQTFNIRNTPITFAGGTRLSFWSNGNILSGSFSRDAMLEIYKYKFYIKGIDSEFPSMSFDADENIVMILLKEDQNIVINNMLVPLKGNKPVIITKEGKIKSAYLAKETELFVNGTREVVMQGKQIIFNEKGDIIEIK